MSGVQPTSEQLARYANGPDGPVVMINLLKFRAEAEGAGGSGNEAYGRYGDAVRPMVGATGGRIVWAGRAGETFIGEPDEDWDAVVLVEYPSRKAFLEMVSRAEYGEASKDRDAGLERTKLIATVPEAGWR